MTETVAAQAHRDRHADAGTGRAGRRRDARVDAAILECAQEVLANSGFQRFSVEEVVSRSGIAKTTIYRRFASRDELIRGVLTSLNDDLAEVSGSSSTRDRLIRLLEQVRRTPSTVRGRILMHAAAEGLRDPAIAELAHDRVLRPRQDVFRQVIREGIARGEIRPDADVDAIIPVLVGPAVHLGMWQSTPVAPQVGTPDVVDLILRGLTRASDS